MNASKKMKNYFQNLEDEAKAMHKIAEAARKEGFDPSNEVEIMLAKNVAEQKGCSYRCRKNFEIRFLG